VRCSAGEKGVVDVICWVKVLVQLRDAVGIIHQLREAIMHEASAKLREKEE
jgi:hypothetical protein